MKKLILILAILTTTGCEANHNLNTQKTLNTQQNQKTLSTKGNHIGTLPDGREIHHYTIKHGYTEHHIYVADNDISINYQVPIGKTTKTETIIIINGIKYIPETAEKE